MSDAYIGEIRWFPYTRGAPNGWLVCNGGLVSISQYETLYMLIGTIYGGDGINTFALPDLRGRVPIHQGQGSGLSNRLLGQSFGSETVTLLPPEMPSHTHIPQASTAAASQTSPGGNVPAALGADTLYISQPSSNSPLLSTAVANTGGTTPHENTAPTLPVVAAICVYGIYPPRN